MKKFILLYLAVYIPLICGCSRGFLYTDMTSPLTTDMDRTKVATKSTELRSDEIKIPLPRGGISTAWNSRALGDAARQGGLKSILYADEHTFSVLGGIWRRRTITVYGE